MCEYACLWWTEDNFVESVLSFHLYVVLPFLLGFLLLL